MVRFLLLKGVRHTDNNPVESPDSCMLHLDSVSNDLVIDI